MITLQSARKYEELLSGEVEASPYDYATLFKADGYLARQRAKARFKLLKVLDAKLRRVLRPDERVYFVTSGSTMSVSEHFFVGWLAYYLNMRALVFTTDRVLLLQINGGKKKVRHLVAQIPNTALASVKSTWSGSCRIKLMDKRELNFVYVPRGDRKFLAEFLSGIVQGTAAPFTTQQPHGVDNLCPHCFVHVPGFPLACPKCTGRFKSAKKAALLSLAFPGLGHWYLGDRGFAVFETLGGGFFWLSLVIGPLLPSPDPTQPRPDAGYWITAAILIGLMHSIDAVMTHHFARKGHHPDGKAPEPAGLPPVIAPAK